MKRSIAATKKYYTNLMRLIHCEFLILLLGVLTFQSVHAEEIRLIVRGDDLGMTQGSVAGFEKAFKEGVLTCASIQVPAPWFEAAVDLAKKHRQWCFGVHLTLIGEWRGYRWRHGHLFKNRYNYLSKQS